MIVRLSAKRQIKASNLRNYSDPRTQMHGTAERRLYGSGARVAARGHPTEHKEAWILIYRLLDPSCSVTSQRCHALPSGQCGWLGCILLISILFYFLP